MSFPISFYSPFATITEDEEKARKEKMSVIIDRYMDKVSKLPTKQIQINQVIKVYNYQGFWYPSGFWSKSQANFSIEAIMSLQDDFQALSTDVFLASFAKSGITWLKALAFAILNRTKFKVNKHLHPIHPLTTTSPHDCVPFIETNSFLTNPSYANGLMASHIPYTSLPQSIINSDCPIIYISRDPKDVLVSYWHFVKKFDRSTPTKLDDTFELFTTGLTLNGSFWDHVIGYYKASLERPNKVLFLTYEKLKKDTVNEVKKLANFLGCPFTNKEEDDRSVQEIIELCSFGRLSEANIANNDGNHPSSNDVYFRKGIVGDSVNYLSTEMIKTLNKITQEKFDGLDISF